MSRTIESTVEKMSRDLANAGVVGDQHVLITILDAEEAAKLVELRRLIAEAERSGDYIDGEEAFSRLRAGLVNNYPELADAAFDR